VAVLPVSVVRVSPTAPRTYAPPPSAAAPDPARCVLVAALSPPEPAVAALPRSVEEVATSEPST
jgi:hypothetical protein